MQSRLIVTLGGKDWPIVSNKLYVVPLMTLLDAVHTDGVAVGGVTGVTPAQRNRGVRKQPPRRSYTEVSDGFSGGALPVKIVHWIAGVTGNLVQALTSAHRFLYGILIVHDFVVCEDEMRITFTYGPLDHEGSKDASTLPFIVTLTPDARNNPPKRLLKIWLPSNVAVAWFVISIPATDGAELLFVYKQYLVCISYLWFNKKVAFSQFKVLSFV